MDTLTAVFERRHDDVGRHRRPLEDFIAERVRNRVHDRAVGRADRRLADAANPDGRLRIRKVDRVADEVQRRIENRRRPVVMEAPCERETVVRVVRPSLRQRVAEAEHRSAEELTLEAERVQYLSDVADGRVIKDLDGAGLGVDFNGREADDVGLRLAVARIRVLRHGDQTLAGERGYRRLREVVDVLGNLVAVVLAAELDGFLRRLRERHAAAWAGTLAAGHLVRVRIAAARFRRDLLKFLDRVGGRRMPGARHRVRRLTSGGDARPRQILRRVAEDHVALLPRHVEHFGGDAVHVESRFGPEITDARLELHTAVRLDDEQAVEADGPARERADGDADAARFGALLLAAVRRLLLFPLEQLAAFVQCFPDERAGHVRLLPGRQGRTERGLARRRVDLPELHLIDAELLRGLREDRLHDADALHPARRALRDFRRRVREHGQTAPAHRLRLIGERDRRACGPRVALRVVRTVVADRVHVDGRDAAIFSEAGLDAREDTGPRAADEVLFLARDAHHHRCVRFLRQQGRNRHEDRPRNLAAEAASGVLADDVHLVRLNAGPARNRRDRLDRALRRAVEIQLAVLPVRHRRARFEGLMARRLRHEGFVHHEAGFLEAFLDVAEPPFVCRLAERQLTIAGVLEIVVSPLPDGDLRSRRSSGRRAAAATRRVAAALWTLLSLWSWRSWLRCARRAACRRCRRRCRTDPHIALRPCVRTAGTQALNRVDDEGQRLEVDVDRFDRFGRFELARRGNRENRLALIERPLGPAAFPPGGRLHGFPRGRARPGAGELLGRWGRFYAGHRHRFARVEPPHARVRHRAREELAEQHAVDAPVLGVSRLASDFCDEIGRAVVFAD